MPATIQIQLIFSAQLAHEADTSREIVQVPSGTRLLELLVDHANRQSARFGELLFSDGTALRRNIVIAVNGTQVPDPASFVLTDNGEVLVMTPIAGG